MVEQNQSSIFCCPEHREEDPGVGHHITAIWHRTAFKEGRAESKQTLEGNSLLQRRIVAVPVHCRIALRSGEPTGEQQLQGETIITLWRFARNGPESAIHLFRLRYGALHDILFWRFGLNFLWGRIVLEILDIFLILAKTSLFSP